MNLREYYQRIRQVEEGLKEPFVTVVSTKTRDGGRRGVKTVVPRTVAAKLLVDGKVKRDAAD
jgi:hypothetical protein